MPFDEDNQVVRTSYRSDYESTSEHIAQSRSLIRTSSRLKATRAVDDTVDLSFYRLRTVHITKREA